MHALAHSIHAYEACHFGASWQVSLHRRSSSVNFQYDNSACVQDAVVIEYAFTWDDSHRHGFAMQILDDMSLNASFIGTGSKSRNAVIPKLEVTLHCPPCPPAPPQAPSTFLCIPSTSRMHAACMPAGLNSMVLIAAIQHIICRCWHHAGDLDAVMWAPILPNAAFMMWMQYFLGRKEFQQMTAQQKVEMLERRECIPAYKGPCSHMGQFMVQVRRLPYHQTRACGHSLVHSCNQIISMFSFACMWELES